MMHIGLHKSSLSTAALLSAVWRWALMAQPIEVHLMCQVKQLLFLVRESMSSIRHDITGLPVKFVRMDASSPNMISAPLHKPGTFLFVTESSLHCLTLLSFLKE